MKRFFLIFSLALVTWFSPQSFSLADDTTKLEVLGFWTENADWKESYKSIKGVRELASKKFGFRANTNLHFVVLAKGAVLETGNADLICRVALDLGALIRRTWESCAVSKRDLFDGYRQIDELTVKVGPNSFVKTELSVIDANSMQRFDKDYSISVSN